MPRKAGAASKASGEPGAGGGRAALSLQGASRSRTPAPRAPAGPVAADAAGSVTVAVRARPGARASAVTGLTAEAVCVAVAAPPSEGEANAELCRYLSRVLGLRKSDVVLDKVGLRPVRGTAVTFVSRIVKASFSPHLAQPPKAESPCGAAVPAGSSWGGHAVLLPPRSQRVLRGLPRTQLAQRCRRRAAASAPGFSVGAASRLQRLPLRPLPQQKAQCVVLTWSLRPVQGGKSRDKVVKLLAPTTPEETLEKLKMQVEKE
ncbi:UPF0235 protein C15orf40 [Galemys pyrenaicus]|uniref:UPF0235 protein C15orf40 n=1 Tax=Galemys pyrenaicus TaxID=202257 RepID=A0A8J6DNV3_GALPY|nr:UPF0235 protein C15orf40 [Galemys pyrenaicus]